MMRRALVAAGVVGLVLAGAAAPAVGVEGARAAAADRSAVIDLGTLGGEWSEAVAVNDRGAVAGTSETADGSIHVFRWTERDGLEDLGAGFAVDINHAGQVIGNHDGRAFFWDPRDGRQDLGTLGGATASAVDLNDRGVVVGASDTETARHAFVWSAGSGIRDLGTLTGEESYATAVNNRGQVTGFDQAREDLPEATAFLWDEGTGMTALWSGLPWPAYFYFALDSDINERGRVAGVVLGYDADGIEGDWLFRWSPGAGLTSDSFQVKGFPNIDPVVINDRGQVLYRSWAPGGFSWGQAYVLDPRHGILEVGSLGGWTSFGFGLNNKGLAVGYSESADGVDFNIHAFSWTQSSGIRDLGTLGGRNSRAFAVNDHGAAVGWADLPDGAQHAVLWETSGLG